MGVRWKTDTVPSLSPQYSVHVSPPATHAAVAHTSAKAPGWPAPERQVGNIKTFETVGLRKTEHLPQPALSANPSNMTVCTDYHAIRY